MTIAAMSTIELVRFRIGSVRYVLPVSSVVAILDVSAVEPDDADTGSVWSGWIRGHAQSIRVASGRQIFGTQDETAASPRVVVLRAATPVGIIVDEVIGSMIVHRGDVYGIPETVGSRRQTLVSAAVWQGSAVELWIDDQALLEALAANEIALDREALPELTGRLESDVAEVLELSVSGSPQRYALPVRVVRHVTMYREPQPIGRGAVDVLGLLAWQSQPVPLISVSDRLGLRSGNQDAGQIVVVGPPAVAGESALPAFAALAVGQVHGIQESVSSSAGQVRTRNGDDLALLDLRRLLENRYRGESRATVLVSQPIPSIETVT